MPIADLPLSSRFQPPFCLKSCVENFNFGQKRWFFRFLRTCHGQKKWPFGLTLVSFGTGSACRLQNYPICPLEPSRKVKKIILKICWFSHFSNLASRKCKIRTCRKSKCQNWKFIWKGDAMRLPKHPTFTRLALKMFPSEVDKVDRRTQFFKVFGRLVYAKKKILCQK